MQQNNFRFVLSYKQHKIAERSFPADCYNQSVRYSVSLRDWVGAITSDFKKVLSASDEDLDFYFMGYDLLQTKFNSGFDFDEILNINPETGYSYEKKPQSEYGYGMTFTLYINQNHIIEREFPVRNFNSNSLFSADLIETFETWYGRIQTRLKTQDETLMWDHYNRPRKDLVLETF